MLTSSLLITALASAPAELHRSSSSLRLFLASVPAGPLAPADLSSSAEHDVVTDYIIIDALQLVFSPTDLFLQQSSQFLFQLVHLFFSACSWFLSFQLIHYAPAGSTWHPPDYEQLTQLWTSPLLIQLPFTLKN
ncbi:hypothetical protein F511_28872 [Dorcoceras hygrometricum]|uniref:Uncharacterized protein n=1 Tax=Dorcoceras hygrometricum TaxID=472368 RepID=A0A2Z7D3I8_9LAMI|nr:hypothetical protein F511_28872 [Dorcoceras hygrometricum]